MLRWFAGQGSVPALLEFEQTLGSSLVSLGLSPQWSDASLPITLTALLLVAIALIVVLTRLRVRDLRRRAEELEEVVARRTDALEQKVLELELYQAQAEETRLRMTAAQDRVNELLQTPPKGEPDLQNWLQPIGRELATTLDLKSLDLWQLRGDHLEFLGPSKPSGEAPDLGAMEEALLGSHWVTEDFRVLVPIAGLYERLVGVLSLGGAPTEWHPEERRLVADFARHAGSIIELQSTHRRLEQLESQRSATRRELIESGYGVLSICPRCEQCFDHSQDHCPLDGTELPKTRRLLPHRIGSRYRLTRVLAQGAVGTVFVARDEQLHRDVAVKILNHQHFRSEQSLIRFEKECLAVARIRHRGVVTLYDSGTLPDGSPFLVMELLDGVDLGRMLANCGAGRPDQVARLVRQGASALETAHREGLIHRDIKPQNLFLAWRTQGFRTKILDFGLAKELADEGTMTQSGLVVGTPAYMSPEQIRERTLDARSDIYSFATVCYYALTGHRAVESTEIVDIFTEVVHQVPPPVSHYVADASSEIDEAFATAMAKDPEHRPSSVLEWAQIAEQIALLRATGPGWVLDGFPEPVARRRRRDTDLPPTLTG